MRRQLRAFHSEQERAALYASRYQHGQWEEHRHRVRHTAALLREMNPQSVADLSCGDGAVVVQAQLTCPAYLGDVTPGWPVTGPIEETIWGCPPVDVFVCSETLEHVEDPEGLLHAIWKRSRRLLLTTPNEETADKGNPEHYWGWGINDLAVMIGDAGWTQAVSELYVPPVMVPYYSYQVWWCE